MHCEMGWTTWNRLDHVWTLAPSLRLEFKLDGSLPESVDMISFTEGRAVF